MLPKFSVLMSIYYRENPEYLDQALTSIWDDQTLKPNEIVLVKDGPLTKELDEVVNKWYLRLAQSLKIVPLAENCGLGVALNEGLAVCSYDIVARMDADDISISDRFFLQLSEFEEGVDLVGGYISEFEESPEFQDRMRKVPISCSDIGDYIRYRNPFNHPSVIYRKSAVQEAGGYKDMPNFEDYYLWARMFINNKSGMKNIPNVLVKMRAGIAQMERRGGLQYLISEVVFFRELSRLDLISDISLYFLILTRIPVRLMPSFVRRYIYLIIRKL